MQTKRPLKTAANELYAWLTERAAYPEDGGSSLVTVVEVEAKRRVNDFLLGASRLVARTGATPHGMTLVLEALACPVAKWRTFASERVRVGTENRPGVAGLFNHAERLPMLRVGLRLLGGVRAKATRIAEMIAEAGRIPPRGWQETALELVALLRKVLDSTYTREELESNEGAFHDDLTRIEEMDGNLQRMMPALGRTVVDNLQFLTGTLRSHLRACGGPTPEFLADCWTGLVRRQWPNRQDQEPPWSQNARNALERQRSRTWTPSPGFVGTNEIRTAARFRKGGKNPSPSTIHGWCGAAERAGTPAKTLIAPNNHEKYYEETWIAGRIEEWRPQGLPRDLTEPKTKPALSV